VLGRAHGRCSWGGHSVRYGTSYVSRHCIRIGTVLEQLDGGTATRVADAADAADADFIVPQPEHTPHTHRGRGSALAPAYLYCTPLTVRRSHSRSHREQRQVGSMRQNAPVDVSAVPAQMNALLINAPRADAESLRCHRRDPVPQRAADSALNRSVQ
jgi:hypothetical protein